MIKLLNENEYFFYPSEVVEFIQTKKNRSFWTSATLFFSLLVYSLFEPFSKNIPSVASSFTDITFSEWEKIRQRRAECIYKNNSEYSEMQRKILT